MITPVGIRESPTSWLSLSMFCNPYSTLPGCFEHLTFCSFLPHDRENDVILRFSINSSCCGWDLKAFQLWADIFTTLFLLVICFSAFLNIILKPQVIFTRSSDTNSNLINIFKRKFVLSLKQNTRHELLNISLDPIPVPACYTCIVLKYTFTSAEKGDKSSRCSCKTFHILLQLPQEASGRTTDGTASTEKDLQLYRNSLQEDILKNPFYILPEGHPITDLWSCV